ncbi:DUF2339 domain-containing protein [Salimicrobium flavidum]|uniref:Predicted membrane protein n=1 Tax=Salimicrobium flavidum TaxID=570947 RepID=A0A1N7J9P2_9BACI|nr:DUF2339 domain-containing protein [Salimicrobium flavidum]SIS46030.1 Predicted membrane protein [Salimicrobium flavidum]
MSEENETNEELSRRLDSLEAEMKEIKELLHEERKSEGGKGERPEPESHGQDKRQWLSPKEKYSPLSEKQSSFRKPNFKDWESVIGQVWLPRIFIIVLLLGVLWAFQSAVENNWITEPIRLVLGYVASVFLLFLGEKQLSSERRGLGITLIGGATGIWIFATFAGAVLYDLFTPMIAFLLYVLCIGSGVVLAEIHKSQALAVYLGIAGFLVPFLVGGEEGNFAVFFTYEVFLTLCLGIYAWRKKKIIVLYVATLLPPVVFFFYTLITALAESGMESVGTFTQEDLFAVFIIIIHVLLSAGTYTEKASVKSKGMLLSLSYAAALFWAGVTLFTPSFVYEAGWLNLNLSIYTALVVAAMSIYGVLAMKRKEGGFFHYYTLFSVVAATVFLVILFDYEGYTLLFIAESYLLFRLGVKIHSSLQLFIGSSMYGISGLATLYHIVEMEWGLTSVLFEGILFIAVSVLLYRLLRSDEDTISKENRRFGVLSTGIGVVGFTLVLLTRVVHLGAYEYFFTYRDVLVSVSWLMFAIGVLMSGIYLQKQSLRIFAVVWIFVTLAKALLVDISYLDPIIRGILFILIGAVGVLVSRFYYTDKHSKKEE